MESVVRVRDQDPLLELTRASSREKPWLLVALLVAACIHVAIAFTAPRLIRHRARAVEEATEVVDIDIPKPPPVIEPPKPEEPPPSKVPEPTSAAAPPPPPAQAAAIVTAAPDPNDPVDFTGGFVTGNAQTYVGGTTAATGTSPIAVRTPPAATGVPGGTGPITAPPAKVGPDRSKRPTLAGDAEWRCPFPAEADSDQIDSAVVTIRVEVAASGKAGTVTVTKDPGHGFGREARRCAQDKTWSPALDHDGVAIPGTAIVNVRFDR
ncbi:MAG: Ferric siderophore transport system, periplasmic binding protein TonB [Myxococcaceae bacterium]|nr:Ferric siderophore transport system, periplasmic binding protein TonB [Myxococcaceae bacterium]